MRLKVSNPYPTTTCSASRCYNTPYIIDASDKRWKGPTPLCQRHWHMVCDDEENVFLSGRRDIIQPPETKELP